MFLNNVVYHFVCDLCNADYVGYTARHLLAIGKHFHEAQVGEIV